MKNTYRIYVAKRMPTLAAGVVIGYALIGCAASSLDAPADSVFLAQAGSCEARQSSELRIIQLWPPNHKFHSIAIGDCVHAVAHCNGALTGEFVWASSDEPIDGIGDGHHAPDIYREDGEHVCVRSERQGPKDGRVYRLAVRVVDEKGREVEDDCLAVVDHDQRGALARDSDEAYRLLFDAADDRPGCDGRPELRGPPVSDTPQQPTPPAPPADEQERPG